MKTSQQKLADFRKEILTKYVKELNFAIANDCSTNSPNQARLNAIFDVLSFEYTNLELTKLLLMVCRNAEKRKSADKLEQSFRKMIDDGEPMTEVDKYIMQWEDIMGELYHKVIEVKEYINHLANQE